MNAYPLLKRQSGTMETAFLSDLEQAGFSGEIETSSSTTTVFSTDNSVYQVEPAAVLFPRTRQDVIILATLMGRPQYREITVTPRGGGTGTNGQSLNTGFIADLSRHMNAIVSVDSDRRHARVQAGVVKDQLNDRVRPDGLFFAPELSTSNRATIGGMVNTDASGQGSCLYGKTRDHIEEIEVVLIGGTVLKASRRTLEIHSGETAIAPEALPEALQRLARDNAGTIAQKFLPLNRAMTGYDLKSLLDDAGQPDLRALFCGSEGTLGFVTEVTVNLVPVPKERALVVALFSDFITGLRSGQSLMQAQPASIETLDGTVLSLSADDPVWRRFPPDFVTLLSGERAIIAIEIVGDDRSAIEMQLERHLERLSGFPAGDILGYHILSGDAQVERFWAMRKKAVGLLGRLAGRRKPVAFVEDTAVPPENLADFIRDFRGILDAHGLAYGMFGHADAGVIHVRPALDMTDRQDRQLIRTITEKVVALTKLYRGVLWGEHGKGFRSAYTREYFGELFPVMVAVKRLFDPFDQLNPGKIASAGAEVAAVDTPPFRGAIEARIGIDARDRFASAFDCNGNGACFNYSYNSAMCPTWKVTRDRRHSPKGRAALIRQWLYVREQAGKPGGMTQAALKNVTSEVKSVLDACMGCGACQRECPVHVDIPEMRSRFYEAYYRRRLRPLFHHILLALETSGPLLYRARALYNPLAGNPLLRWLARRAGIVNLPRYECPSAAETASIASHEIGSIEEILGFPAARRERAVVIFPEMFTRYLESPVLAAAIKVIRALGREPVILPYTPSGKVHQLLGARKQYARLVRRNAGNVGRLFRAGFEVVCIEPAIHAAFGKTYDPDSGGEALGRIRLIDAWLCEKIALMPRHERQTAPLTLFPHCSEKTRGNNADWQTIFAHLGVSSAIANVGCCGMSGYYGHVAENDATSAAVHALSWASAIPDATARGRVCATGYSCRSQARLRQGATISHPLIALAEFLHSEDTGTVS